MMVQKTLVLLLLLGTSVLAQTVPATTGSAVSQKDAQAALDHHNKARKDVGVAAMQWSPELAKHAQEWADYLAKKDQFKHRPTGGPYKREYGENIFYTMSSNKRSAVNSENTNYALLASEDWYSEITDYKYEKKYSAKGFKAGHYTQMIWKNSTQVGMGMARSKSGKMIVVANYNPPGNVFGEKIY